VHQGGWTAKAAAEPGVASTKREELWTDAKTSDHRFLTKHVRIEMRRSRPSASESLWGLATMIRTTACHNDFISRHRSDP